MQCVFKIPLLFISLVLLTVRSPVVSNRVSRVSAEGIRRTSITIFYNYCKVRFRVKVYSHQT